MGNSIENDSVSRRSFVRKALFGCTAVMGGSGLLYVRRTQARSSLAAQLSEDALPTLAEHSRQERDTLPVRARDEITRYFHGKCLNVAGFVSHICSEAFRRELGGCASQEEREVCLLQAFCARIATAKEILDKVQRIAAELGGELDATWSGYCSMLSSRWSERIAGRGEGLTVDNLTNRLSGIVRSELARAAQEAISETRQPMLDQTGEKIGATAIMLRPLARMGTPGLVVAVPVFVVLAFIEIWPYIAAQLEDRQDDYQLAISTRLATLGNRVGKEFELEMKQRLSDLHAWQELSVRQVATRLAEERIGLI